MASCRPAFNSTHMLFIRSGHFPVAMQIGVNVRNNRHRNLEKVRRQTCKGLYSGAMTSSPAVAKGLWNREDLCVCVCSQGSAPHTLCLCRGPSYDNGQSEELPAWEPPSGQRHPSAIRWAVRTLERIQDYTPHPASKIPPTPPGIHLMEVVGRLEGLTCWMNGQPNKQEKVGKNVECPQERCSRPDRE